MNWTRLKISQSAVSESNGERSSRLCRHRHIPVGLGNTKSVRKFHSFMSINRIIFQIQQELFDLRHGFNMRHYSSDDTCLCHFQQSNLLFQNNEFRVWDNYMLGAMKCPSPCVTCILTICIVKTRVKLQFQNTS